ncbi:hypothetical protein C8R45DRAFT_928036 [Mycena sanguinolenta]|nr:hypothetical protein C8R45DRAFT_928036 [Mycena sanguinolenta]
MLHTQFGELSLSNSSGKENERRPSSRAKLHSNPTSSATQFERDFEALRNTPGLVLTWPPPPSPEIPNFPSDWWHNLEAGVAIINGTNDLWSGDNIPFISDHTNNRAFGISMKQARLGVGMLYGQTRLKKWVRPVLFGVPRPMLSIQWPGYQSVEERGGLRPLNFERPLYLKESCTLVQLAQQVADYFFEFSEIYGANCNPNDPKAIRLGPGAVTFDRLRLVKLWTTNRGISWIAEVAIVKDYMRH